MGGLGMSILEEGMEKGIEQGMEKGIEQGMERGIEQGKSSQIVASVANLMKSLSLTLEEACKALNIEVNDYEKAKNIIK